MLWQSAIIRTVERNIFNHISNFPLLKHQLSSWQKLDLLLPVQVLLCVSLQTCWQVGSWPSLARISSHSGESLAQAELSTTFSSTWARCLNTAEGRPTSARSTSSITWRTAGKQDKRMEVSPKLELEKGVALGSNPRALTFEFRLPFASLS